MEACASKALQGDVPAYDVPLSLAEVVSVAANLVNAVAARITEGRPPLSDLTQEH